MCTADLMQTQYSKRPHSTRRLHCISPSFNPSYCKLSLLPHGGLRSRVRRWPGPEGFPTDVSPALSPALHERNLQWQEKKRDSSPYDWLDLKIMSLGRVSSGEWIKAMVMRYDIQSAPFAPAASSVSCVVQRVQTIQDLGSIG